MFSLHKQTFCTAMCFSHTSITTVLKRELNLIKRKSITGEALFSELKRLYAQHEMREWLDRRRLQGEEQPIPLIVCSQALV